MSSESDRQLSMEELRRRNMQSSPPTEARHLTAAEWSELTAALTAMGEILAEQVLLLEKISARPSLWATKEQAMELIQEAKEIRRLLEQAGKKRGRRCSLPSIRLPPPTLEWLIIPAVLVGFLALWYGWVTLWNGLRTLFP